MRNAKRGIDMTHHRQANALHPWCVLLRTQHNTTLSTYIHRPTNGRLLYLFQMSYMYIVYVL
jgi:hypothetical protein